MAKPSICVVALIASIVSLAFHMPGVDASGDIGDFLENASNQELADFLPGYTLDAAGNLVPEVSHPDVGGPADSSPALNDLPPLGSLNTGEPDDFGDMIDINDMLAFDDNFQF